MTSAREMKLSKRINIQLSAEVNQHKMQTQAEQWKLNREEKKDPSLSWIMKNPHTEIMQKTLREPKQTK